MIKGGFLKGTKILYRVFSSALVAVSALSSLGYAQQLPSEVGVVYWVDGTNFKALEKEAAPASGRAHYSAKVKGAHASLRVASGKQLTFRVCSVDPTRYKLYRFHTTKSTREITLSKVNMWVGGAKSVLSESEVPITFQSADTGCFTIRTNGPMSDGEYGFSPAGDEYAFTFGIGAPN